MVFSKKDIERAREVNARNVIKELKPIKEKKSISIGSKLFSIAKKRKMIR